MHAFAIIRSSRILSVRQCVKGLTTEKQISDVKYDSFSITKKNSKQVKY